MKKRKGAPQGRAIELVLANLFYAAMQLMLLLVLTRAASVLEVGRFAYALAITGPLHLAVGMRLRSVRVVDKTSAPLSSYVLTATLAGLLSLVLATAISALLLDNMMGLSVVVAVSASKLVEGIVDVYYGEWQRLGQIRTLAVAQVGRAVAGLAGFTLGVATTGGALGGSLGLTLAWSGLLLVQTYRQRLPVLGGSVNSVWAITRRAWPLGAASGLNSLNASSSRLVAEGLLGTSATGLIAIVSYPGSVISIVANSFGQAMLARLREAYDSGNRSATIKMNLYLTLFPLTLGLGMIATAVLWGGSLLAAAFGQPYSAYSTELIIMLTAATVSSLSTAMYYWLLARAIIARQGVVALVTTLVGLPLLILLGITGRSVTSLALGALGMSVVQFLGYAVILAATRRRHTRSEESL